MNDWSEIAALCKEAESLGRADGLVSDSLVSDGLVSVGLVVVAPDGEVFANNANRPYRAASTVKVPLMVEVFRAIERGALSLDRSYTLLPADVAPGTGVMLHITPGSTLRLNDLIYLMISISDNTATNVLIDWVGMEAVNATMRELGMSGSCLARKMKGRPAVGDEPENWATAQDYAHLMQLILNSHAATPASCETMIQMLQTQQNTRRIARYLPKDDNLRWGSKTGTISGVVNEVGFIQRGNRNLIISVFCENFPNEYVAEEFIGRISIAAVKLAQLAS